MSKKITKDMLIGDVVKVFPDSIEVLMKHGMRCVGCHVATWETIEQAAQSHGIDVDRLIGEVNKVLKWKLKYANTARGDLIVLIFPEALAGWLPAALLTVWVKEERSFGEKSINRRKWGEIMACGTKCEVYSRIVGYYRPLENWNIGKREEFKDRWEFDSRKALLNEFVWSFSIRGGECQEE